MKEGLAALTKFVKVAMANPPDRKKAAPSRKTQNGEAPSSPSRRRAVAYWLLVERLENWEVDKREGFRRFGLPESKEVMARQIRKGDLLIAYVSSGISSFADIRKAMADEPRKLGFGGDYDTAFPLAISTAPHLTLSRSNWVPIHSLTGRLSFTAGKGDWRQIMRTALRPLADADATVIIDAMKYTTFESGSYK